MQRRARLLITLGDPCGVGPELLLKSLHALTRWADITVVGARAGADLLQRSPTAPSIHWRFGEASLPGEVPAGCRAWGLWTGSEAGFQEKQLLAHAQWIDPVPDLGAEDLALGQGSAFSGRAAVESVRVASELMQAGAGDALVTLPLSKAAAHQAGFDIPGHTEYLQQITGSPLTRMAFLSPSLSVGLHPVHQSLRSVPDELPSESVAETRSFAADRFIQLTGRMDLRVALCALNPHAGEGGAFGDEEALLQDAIIQAEACFLDFSLEDQGSVFPHVASPFPTFAVPEGWQIFPTRPRPFTTLGGHRDIEIQASEAGETSAPSKPSPQFFGPLPSDSLFHRAAKGEFDLVVALYHDQGLIPMKVLEPARSVNLTLGLPFVRTSPDHGTAFDIAGSWRADPTNFLEAAALAVRLAGRAHQQVWKADLEHP